MRVLVACEFSGVVRRAFRELGHDAWSCDLLPADETNGTVFRVRDLGVENPLCLPIREAGLTSATAQPALAAVVDLARSAQVGQQGFW